MAYTTTELITNSYYLSGVVARDFQTVSGSQLSDGLNLLNAYLSVKTANEKLIPYYKEHNLTAQIGIEKYFVENLVAIESITYTIGDLRYPMGPSSRREYFGSARVNNVNSLPFKWRAERSLGGTDFYLYFFPADTYPLQIWGKFGLATVVLGEDLTLSYDAFYIEYLRHGLAEYICSENNMSLQPEAAKRLMELEEILMQVSPPDLTVTRISTIGSSTGGLNWGDVNIGRGWRPP